MFRKLLTPEHRIIFAKILLVVCILGWPLSVLIIFGTNHRAFSASPG